MIFAPRWSCAASKRKCACAFIHTRANAQSANRVVRPANPANRKRPRSLRIGEGGGEEDGEEGGEEDGEEGGEG